MVQRRMVGRTIVDGAAWIICGFLVLPIFVTLPSSLTPNDYLSLPKPGELSIVQYGLFFDPGRRWVQAFGDSSLVALMSTALAVGLGVPCAVGVWRLASRLSELVLLFVLMPLMVPAVAMALGTYWVWIRIGLFDTYLGTVVAHAVAAGPFVVITVLTSLSGFDLTIEKAARSLGASPYQFVWMVLLPSIKTGILSGAAIAFIVSWDELVITLFVTGQGVVTLPKRMWEALQHSSDPVVAAASSIMILATVAVLLWRLSAVRRGRTMLP